MGQTADIFKLAKKIKHEIKSGNVEDYNTGLLGEQIIVASYQTMPLDKLEKMQFIISKIIKKKKEFLRVQNANVNPPDNDSNYMGEV
jgi:hypothetical protein